MNSHQVDNRKGSGAGVGVCGNPPAFLLALKGKLNKADSCLLPFTSDMEFSSVAFFNTTCLVQWTAFGSEGEYRLYSGDYLHPHFVLRVAFKIFVSTCFFIIDYLFCDGCVT